MESTQETRKMSGGLNIPTAIVIAGAIIAIAVIYTKAPSVQKPPNQQADTFEQKMKPITDADYIIGNPKAKIKIVEYSDASCPYCKVFHNTMRKVMSDYGTSGNVAWLYRHYTLDKPDPNGNILHPNAGREAQAMECAGSLGGNEKFWTFTNRLYEVTPSVTGATPNGLDPKELPKIAEFSGINVTDFNNCLSTSKFKEKVEADFVDGVNIGINGTPSSIIVLEKAFPASVKEKLMQIYDPYKNPQTGEYPIKISSDSKMVLLGGAMPIEAVKATIDLFFTY
jgi:protein-disulfide isomerase